MTHSAPSIPSTPPPMTAPVPAGRSFIGLFLLLLLGLAALWYSTKTSSELIFVNRLMAPVRLVVGSDGHTLAPGGTVQLRLPRGRMTVAEWEMVRPLSADGGVMGVPLRGSVVADGRGRIHGAAESRGRDADYFAPLITNAAAVPLRIVVNAGSRDAQDCHCAVRPGARRVFIGYYPLYKNSTVQASAAGGRRATFQQLGPEVKAPDGTVGLRFTERDLQP